MSTSDIIEARSFDFVPEDERHGTAMSQAQFWFMINATLITLFTGAIGPLYKLDLSWTLVAIVLGSAFGTLFQAFHGAQGPRMGLPQMIQSRVQFGSRGAVVPLVAAMLAQFGFAVFFIQTGAQSFVDVTGIKQLSASQVVFGISAMLIAIIGYKLVLRVEKIASYLTLVNLVLLTIASAVVLPVRTMLSVHHFAVVPFLAQFGAAATYQIAIAPIVSDYTRYMPTRTPGRAVSSAVFWGTIVSAIWLESLGAVLAIAFPDADAIASIRKVGDTFGYGLGTATMIIAVLSCLITCAISFYSGTVTLLSAAEAFRSLRSTVGLRAKTVIGGGGVAIAAVLLMPANILDAFSAFLSILGYLLIPWTAVNLTDYYFVRRGVFSISDIMRSDGGIYGRWNVAGIISYTIGFVAMIPFFSTSIYLGPVAAWLDKADIAFFVGLLVSTFVYVTLMRNFDLDREAELVARAELNTIDDANTVSSRRSGKQLAAVIDV
jgi:nucleobase:cation symporter-1, NCS1 family